MIVDRQTLYVFTFNYTYLDIGSTRSFAVITSNSDLVREATRLCEADVKRQAYTPELETFLVSPINARQELSRFIEKSEKQLLIYDPEISDPRMIRLLRERAKAGVEIRIIGRVKKDSSKLGASGLMRMRFHTRTIVRDRHTAFLGSQSLREAELNRKRGRRGCRLAHRKGDRRSRSTDIRLSYAKWHFCALSRSAFRAVSELCGQRFAWRNTTSDGSFTSVMIRNLREEAPAAAPALPARPVVIRCVAISLVSFDYHHVSACTP